MIDISIAEAHNRLSALLKKVEKHPIRITRRGKAVGVILSTRGISAPAPGGGLQPGGGAIAQPAG